MTKLKNKTININVSSIAQYMRALHFEHKLSRKELLELGKIEENREFRLAPRVEVVKNDECEVVLAIQIISSIKESKVELYQLALEYSGIYKITGEIDEASKEELLLINCSTLLFPFARSEIMHITSTGGYGSILMDPVDFASVYKAYKEQKISQKVN
jgi:preprotein translocase subunit SecB